MKPQNLVILWLHHIKHYGFDYARELFLKNVAQTSDFPLALEIERAEGVYLYDTEGKSYLDLISGIGVSNVGHRHPKVVEAIKDQVDKYMHLMVYGEFVQSPQVQLAKALVDSLTPSAGNRPVLDNVYFTNSGTEAIEGAMKLAGNDTHKEQSSYLAITLTMVLHRAHCRYQAVKISNEISDLY
jgi:4-aminobutyrate aminotransferase-like enzyme